MLEHRVERALRALGVADTDPVGVACSGGADSIALLHLLARVRSRLHVLHVDHGLRDGSSADARFVEEQARSLDLGCTVCAVDVQRKRRGSLEAVAREARYAALERAREDLSLQWVATAHTRDDQAETVLLRLLRGGSLGGIDPVSGRLVRPLLGIDRAELREWLRVHSIEWREDPTNADMSLERNWVRGVLLPTMQSRRAGVTKVLARAADGARDDEDALDAIAATLFERAAVDETGVFLSAEELAGLPSALRTRLFRSALRCVGVDPTWSELDAINALRAGRRVRCRGARVDRITDGVSFLRDPVSVPDRLPLPPEGIVEAVRWGIRVRVGPAEANPWLWRSALTAEPATIRSRRPGDRVRTSAGTRKVQDVLVDAKIPSSLRDLVPLVASDRGALAVVGLTSYPVASGTVVDVEPCSATWSRKVVWTRASA
jgi:tRNA(Ile)-lysidine synthase